MDSLQVELCNWILTYNGVYSHLTGKDREEALKVINDDDAFDRWKEMFDKEQSKVGQETPAAGRRIASQEAATREWKPPT